MGVKRNRCATHQHRSTTTAQATGGTNLIFLHSENEGTDLQNVSEIEPKGSLMPGHDSGKPNPNREAITEHLQEIEEIYLAQQVLERVRAGKEATVSLENLMEQYGLVGADGASAMQPDMED